MHIFHGDSDNVVPPEHALDLRKRMQKSKYANSNVSITMLKGEQHSIQLQSNQIFVAQRDVKSLSVRGADQRKIGVAQPPTVELCR